MENKELERSISPFTPVPEEIYRWFDGIAQVVCKQIQVCEIIAQLTYGRLTRSCIITNEEIERCTGFSLNSVRGVIGTLLYRNVIEVSERSGNRVLRLRVEELAAEQGIKNWRECV